MTNYLATTTLKTDLDNINGKWVLPFAIEQQHTNPLLQDNQQPFQVWRIEIENKELGLVSIKVEDGNDKLIFVYYITCNSIDENIEFILENQTFCYISER